MNKNVITVSMLNQYIKSIMERDYILNSILVQGEISNFKHHFSGHMYFTLKDTQSSIKCVMFKRDVQNLIFTPEDGMAVTVKGRISLYERDGVYQIYTTNMEPIGKGSLQLAYEQLKEKLNQEGLFDVSYKKRLPSYPKKIGIVTSGTGAAIRDIIHVAQRRNPKIELILYPVLVQGSEASFQIAKAIEDFNKLKNVDLLIIGRGGGSIEDLWAFNEEIVARSIFASEIPIISAVGHETDFTISDFVADFRAPTPSAGAEIAVPDLSYIMEDLHSCTEKLIYQINNLIQGKKIRWKSNKDILISNNPLDKLKQNQIFLDQLQNNLKQIYKQYIERKSKDLSIVLAKLDSISPLKVLVRGYGMIETEKGEIISSAKKMNQGDNIKVVLKDGKIYCKINQIKYEGEE